MMNYELNESQLAAVECCDAPSLVIAGAGSGKTRVLTYKIAYLLDHGVMPYHILALTFTNKAAREMQSRIGELVGMEQASPLWMGTFHSIFSRILRMECAYLGFTSDFTIYDATDSKSLIRGLIREMGLDEKQYKPGTVCSHISAAKNALVLPSAYHNSRECRMRDEASRMPQIYDIYQRYAQRLRLANAMDFDDLLLYTWLLFRDHPDVAARYQERFHYILVDEYQDTNYAQHQIVWQLSNVRQRVCVVGDDAQSIYSFRGANIDNILNFQTLYQGARLFKLEQNYRSTQMIVGAANSLIHHNQRQIHKDVFSRQAQGSPVEVIQAYSDVDEANVVLRKIHALTASQGITYGQIAILYRTNAQSRSFEDTLRRAGVPYRIYGGLSFYQRKEIKDAIAYMRLAVNPRDEEALRRVINYPARGIGETTVGRLFFAAANRGVSPWDILCHPELLDVNRGTQEKLRTFAALISGFHERATQDDAYALSMSIATDSGLRADIFQGHEPDDVSRQENLQELMDGISSFVQEHTEQGLEVLLTNYLQEVSLLSDLDDQSTRWETGGSSEASEEKVTLMTVHSAKGLEFDAVFVVGLEEDLFPSQLSVDSPRQIEEERRLFYVAMTRARSHLFITYAKSRFRYGKIEYASPSRFLREIDPRYLKSPARENPEPKPFDVIRGGGSWRRTDRPSQPSTWSTPRPSVRSVADTPAPRSQRLVPLRATRYADIRNGGVPPASLVPGQRIVHERFGVGTVEEVTGTGMDTKARVNFDNVGVKQLLLRFAKFRIL